MEFLVDVYRIVEFGLGQLLLLKSIQGNICLYIDIFIPWWYETLARQTITVFSASANFVAPLVCVTSCAVPRSSFLTKQPSNSSSLIFRTGSIEESRNSV